MASNSRSRSKSRSKSRSRLRRSSRLRQKAGQSSPTPTRQNGNRRQISKSKETIQRNSGSRSAPRLSGPAKPKNQKSPREDTPRPSTSAGIAQHSCRSTRSSSNRGHHSRPSSRVNSPWSRKQKRLAIIRNLRKRIRAISMDGRPIPTVDNIRVLAQELKIRLASRCLPIREAGRRGGKVKVTAVPQREHVVSLLKVTRDQNCVVLSKQKVAVTNWKTLSRQL